MIFVALYSLISGFVFGLTLGSDPVLRIKGRVKMAKELLVIAFLCSVWPVAVPVALWATRAKQ